MKRTAIALLVILVVLCLSSCGTPTRYTEKPIPIEDSTDIKETIQPDPKESENEAIETDNVAANTENVDEESDTLPELPSGTIGEQNALKQALSYLRYKLSHIQG